MVTSGTSQQDTDTARKTKPGILDFLKTVPGILTAVATLITASAGAFYGGTQLSSGTPRPTVTVTAPARTVTESAAANHQGSQSQAAPAGSDPSSAAGKIYLSSLAPLQDNEGTGATVINGPQQIGTTGYPDTVRLTCGTEDDESSVVYEVAGFKTLQATIGVPSDATNASDNSASIQFLKDGTSTQLAPGITVALDQPQVTTVPLKGASQLGISCTGSNGDIDIALANATLNP
jgi:hypothetical protein